MNSIGKTIRALRKSRKWVLEDLAHRVGTDGGNISRIERGLQDPSFKLLEKIADAFGLTMGELFNMVNPNAPEINIVTQDRPEGPPPVNPVPIISWSEVADWKGCGSPLKYKDHIYPAIMCSPRSFALIVEDDSMIGDAKEAIAPGHTIIVDPTLPAANSKYVLSIKDGMKTPILRQYTFDGVNTFLKPLNKQYPNIDYSEFKHCGTVINVVRY